MYCSGIILHAGLKSALGKFKLSWVIDNKSAKHVGTLWCNITLYHLIIQATFRADKYCKVSHVRQPSCWSVSNTSQQEHS